MKPLSLQGLWWLPETPGDRQTGTLTFDQVAGAKLSVVGRLAPLQTGPIDVGNESCVVYGFTTVGQPVTLLNAFVLNSQLNFPGIGTEAWHVSTIAVGAHFASADEKLFTRSWARFDGIARWLANNPFVENYDFDPHVTQLTVRKPPQQKLGLVPGAEIYTGYSLKSGREGDERWASESEAMIAIESEAPQTLSWYFEAAVKLRSLVELLYGRPLHLTKLQVELAGEPEAEGLSYADVEIYAQMIGGDSELPPVDRWPMLTAPALLEAAPNALEEWFAQYDKLSAAMHLLSAVASDRRMFINVRFLLAAQAVETFHREAYPSTIVPKVEHDEIVKALTAAVPPGTMKEMREKLASLLQYANEPSLRQRLGSLIALARDGRGEVMPAYGKSFIDAVVATRNYETHHGKRPRNLLRGAEMHRTIRRLVVLLTVLFLRRLGLRTDAIDAMITGHREFRTLWTTSDTP